MELIGKVFLIFKIAIFVSLIWKYGFNGYNAFNQDFERVYRDVVEPNLEMGLAFIAGSSVGISETIKAHIDTDFGWLFFLAFSSFISVVVKALLTSLITFYFTKFLKDPSKAYNWIKNKIKSWKK